MRASKVIFLVLVITALPGAALGTWFLDWRAQATISKATWTLTGSNSVSRSITPLFTAYSYVGAVPLTNSSSAKLTTQILINDNTSSGCSAVRVELHGRRLDSTSCTGSCTSTGQVTSPFRSQSWSTCINGSNVDYFTSSTYGAGPTTLTEGDGGNMGTPTAGDNCYLFSTYIIDDFGSGNGQSCYKTWYQ
jgi:hypothetical protein